MATKVADEYLAIAKRLAEIESEKLQRVNEPEVDYQALLQKVARDHNITDKSWVPLEHNAS